MSSDAFLIPSSMESTKFATYNAAPEFKTTISLLGPLSPLRILIIISAFSFASPPLISSKVAFLKPSFSGSSL